MSLPVLFVFPGGCTYLGSLGSVVTYSIGPICCQTAQGAKATTVAIVFTQIANVNAA